MGKKLLLAGAAVLLVLVAFLAGCQTGVGGAVAGPSAQQTGIWVSGEGKVSAAPDIATIDLGVTAQSKTVADAQSQAANAMNKVVSALTAAGVAQKDIQTRVFSVSTVTHYNNQTGENIFDGFQVTNTVSAKLRDLPKVGDTIDSVIAAGGDLARINNLAFTIEDPIRYQDQVLQKAMTNAQDKAELLANLAGVKLGRPTFISTSATTPVPPVPIAISGKISADASSTPISPGQLDIVTDVQVVYSIR